MDYKKLMGYGDTKKVTKKVSKPKVNEVLNSIKDEFGYVNDCLLYDYGKSLKAIEKAENLQAKAVNNFVKILKKKGFPKEATNVASMYMVQMRKFDEYMKELADKLL